MAKACWDTALVTGTTPTAAEAAPAYLAWLHWFYGPPIPEDFPRTLETVTAVYDKFVRDCARTCLECGAEGALTFGAPVLRKARARNFAVMCPRCDALVCNETDMYETTMRFEIYVDEPTDPVQQQRAS
ncbi:MAG: hypothetical protein ACR2JC_06210 [Chloroflexota bacterium]